MTIKIEFYEGEFELINKDKSVIVTANDSRILRELKPILEELRRIKRR